MKTIKIKGQQYPSHIDLLSRTITVEWHEGKCICDPNNQLVQGWFDFQNQIIHMDRTMKDSAIAEVLWHEIGHAIYWMLQNEEIQRTEEDVVNLMAITHITIARNNPGLFTWLDVLAQQH